MDWRIAVNRVMGRAGKNGARTGGSEHRQGRTPLSDRRLCGLMVASGQPKARDPGSSPGAGAFFPRVTAANAQAFAECEWPRPRARPPHTSKHSRGGRVLVCPRAAVADAKTSHGRRRQKREGDRKALSDSAAVPSWYRAGRWKPAARAGAPGAASLCCSRVPFSRVASGRRRGCGPGLKQTLF